MREIISRKMVQRSPFWPSRRLVLERQQSVLNTTGRFAELANNVKHSSSIYMYTHTHTHLPVGYGCQGLHHQPQRNAAVVKEVSGTWNSVHCGPQITRTAVTWGRTELT